MTGPESRIIQGETSPSVDPEEVARFAALADSWWDPEGTFRPLHKFNPVRLAFIRDRLTAHFGRDPRANDGRPLAGIRLLDVGAGGGLLAEPMARLGATVTGIDAAEKNVAVARLHADRTGLTIDYRQGTAEDLAAAGETFDAVLNMEVIEHVADRSAFLAACCQLVAPKGVMILATLNRTPKSYLMAIVGAEYVLRWLPRGTHDWRRFVRPSELAALLGASGFEMAETTGVAYNPLNDKWTLARDVDVNYMVVATRRE